jgi:hypothetical protein
VQVEAVEMGVARAAPGDDRRRRIASDPHHQMAGAPPGGHPAEHRRTPNPGQRRIVERQRIAGLLLFGQPVQVDAMAAHEPHDPPSHRDEQSRYLDVGRGRRGRNEPQRSVRPLFEHAFGHQGVAVDVGVERRSAPLNGGDGTAAAVNPLLARPAPLEGEHRAYEYRQDGPAETMIVGEPVTQSVR